MPSPSRPQWSPCQTKRSPESNLCNVWKDNIVIINTAQVDFGIIIIIAIITTSITTATINITFIILIACLIMIKTRCVISDLVRVDKDKAVVGVETARGERLLDRLARQLGRASDLVKMVVMIGSRKSRGS